MSSGAWLVLDMDNGLLRSESTRRAALAWLHGWTLTDVVRQRWTYGPGAYQYIVGERGGRPDDTRGAFIERVDAARGAGWDVDQQPLYPHDGTDRFTPIERDAAEPATT